jgi:hypothetical protein
LVSQRRMLTSARYGSPEINSVCDFPWPVFDYDGYEWSIGAVEGPLEDRRKDFWESVVQTSDIKESPPFFFSINTDLVPKLRLHLHSLLLIFY